MATIPGFFEGTGMPDPGWWEALWSDPANVLVRAGIVPGMAVIDLCCGDGWFTLPMARIARHVFAVDIDRSLLDIARARLLEAGIENVDLIEANAYDIDKLAKMRTDFVFMANAFHGVPDPPRLARAVAAVLAPRGKFAAINWHRRPREETVVLGIPRGPETALRISPEETIAAVEAGGLRAVKVVEIPPYHYAAIFENSP